LRIEKETYICISRSCMSPNKKRNPPKNYLLMVVKGLEMVVAVQLSLLR
jgi:hypothetical protein